MGRAEKEKKGFFGELFEIIKIILSAIVLAAIIVQVVRPTRVDGESMMPTLENRDYLIINRLTRYYGLDRGDIVVFDSNLTVDGVDKNAPRSFYKEALDFILQDDSRTKDLVKRVIGLQGDHIRIKDGKVSVNDITLKENYVSPGNITEGDYDLIVPEGKIFVMGDNRMNSLDSRYPQVGFVDKSKVVGTVMVRLLPLSAMGKVD